MSFTVAIIGRPNVGKSTLFNALVANAKAEAANYPFCTIEPNSGIVAVPDGRLALLSALSGSKELIPTRVEFVDIAGLVKGAAAGEGLGNKFLSHIREVDAIMQVVRCFVDDDITHVGGGVNPLSDIETIETELLLADMQTLENSLPKAQRSAKSGDKEAKLRATVMEKCQAWVNDSRPLRTCSFTDEEKAIVRSIGLMTAKPVLFVANVAEDDLDGNGTLVQQVRQYATTNGANVVPICAKLEAELAELDEADRNEMLQSVGLTEPGLGPLARAAYKTLGLQSYFTAGEKEVRAWTVQQGATAPQAAGVIHTDFEHGFIRAEVIGYEDFIACKGEQGAKEAGKMRLEGKEYIVRDGDVMHFRFNV